MFATTLPSTIMKRLSLLFTSLSCLAATVAQGSLVGDTSIFTTESTQLTASTLETGLAAGQQGGNGNAVVVSNSVINASGASTPGILAGGPIVDNGGNTVTGGTSIVANSFFTTTAADLAALSADLSAQVMNGSASVSGFTLSLTGTDPTQNVFTVASSVLASPLLFGTIQIDVPLGSSVLINVTGTSALNKGFTTQFVDGSNATISDDLAGRTLFHFPDVVTPPLGMNVQGSFAGTLFAPNSRIAFVGAAGNNTLRGQIVAQEVQLNNYDIQFESTHGFFEPNLNPIPEPQVLVATISLGVLSLLSWRRLKTRRQTS